MASVAPPPLSLPDLRLGEMLRRAREAKGRSLHEVAIRAGISGRVLRRFEEGRQPFTGEELLRISRAYGVHLTDLIAARAGLELDLSAGTLSLADRKVVVDTSAVDKVLRRYLALVRELRGLGDGARVDLRGDDVAQLADVLDLHADDVAHRLGVLMGCDDAEARRRWQVLRDWRVAGSVALGAIGIATVATLGPAHSAATATVHAPTAAEAAGLDPGDPAA